MNSCLLLTAAFILALGAGLPLVAQDQSRPLVRWPMADGGTTYGRFVKLAGDAVVIIGSRNKESTIPFAKLSPTGVELAQRLAAAPGDPALGAVLNMGFCGIFNDEFRMGSTEPKSGTTDDETQHMVKLNRFYLKNTEVTWAEWNAVRGVAANYGYTDISVGRNGYNGDASGTHPVTEISWWDAIKWCNLASQIEGRTPVYYTAKDYAATNILKTGTPDPYPNWDADGYRLPTEAEWESACYTRERGGPVRFVGNVESFAWCAKNSEGNTHPVGDMAGLGRESDAYGGYGGDRIFDMLGNVAEWCWDWEGPLDRDARDPRGAASGGYRIFRGGCWADKAWCCRISYRGGYSPITPRSYLIGFRPAHNMWRHSNR